MSGKVDCMNKYPQLLNKIRPSRDRHCLKNLNLLNVPNRKISNLGEIQGNHFQGNNQIKYRSNRKVSHIISFEKQMNTVPASKVSEGLEINLTASPKLNKTNGLNIRNNNNVSNLLLKKENHQMIRKTQNSTSKSFPYSKGEELISDKKCNKDVTDWALNKPLFDRTETGTYITSRYSSNAYTSSRFSIKSKGSIYSTTGKKIMSEKIRKQKNDQDSLNHPNKNLIPLENAKHSDTETKLKKREKTYTLSGVATKRHAPDLLDLEHHQGNINSCEKEKFERLSDYSKRWKDKLKAAGDRESDSQELAKVENKHSKNLIRFSESKGESEGTENELNPILDRKKNECIERMGGVEGKRKLFFHGLFNLAKSSKRFFRNQRDSIPFNEIRSNSFGNKIIILSRNAGENCENIHSKENNPAEVSSRPSNSDIAESVFTEVEITHKLEGTSKFKVQKRRLFGSRSKGKKKSIPTGKLIINTPHRKNEVLPSAQKAEVKHFNESTRNDKLEGITIYCKARLDKSYMRKISTELNFPFLVNEETGTNKQVQTVETLGCWRSFKQAVESTVMKTDHEVQSKILLWRIIVTDKREIEPSVINKNSLSTYLLQKEGLL